MRIAERKEKEDTVLRTGRNTSQTGGEKGFAVPFGCNFWG